ncbi:DNA repair protein RAD51 homolog 2-like [Amphiura filiformis]|uniref:DNA repair protein RAD51 homolog 2-like n=1 Tax=Amphiura filiformis TaxID=82378 RepID=UPI003B215D85
MTRMASRRIQRLGVDPEVTERLRKHGVLTCQHILSKSRMELLRLTALSDIKVKGLLLQASKAAMPEHITALDLYERPDKECPVFFPSSLLKLDALLHGGFPTGTISEIAGPPGCGKTQFCIMLSVLATLPRELGGLNGGVVYIDTESAFSAERLVEVARHRFPGHFSREEAFISLTSRVHLYLESTCHSLLTRLEHLEEELISKGIRLIILDSVASLVRKEFDNLLSGNLIERTNLLSKEAAILKYLAETFSIPVVVTNQITTRINQPSSHASMLSVNTGAAIVEGEGSYVTAALGNTWSHNVNTRLILQFLDEHRRQIMIAKSPIAPFATLVYTIQDKGIVLEDDGMDPLLVRGTDPGLQQIRVRTSISHAIPGEMWSHQ